MSNNENCYVLISRLQIDEERIPVGPGLTLRRIPPISVFDLAAAGSAGFREWAILEPVINVCRVEIESTKESAATPGYDALNRAWLVSSLILLRGYCQHACLACSAYSWATIADRNSKPADSPPRFSGNLLDFHLRSLVTRECRSNDFSTEDGAWIFAHFEAFNELCAGSEPFRFALEAFADWRFSQNSRSAIARLWGGIESLFSVNSELVFRISVTAAALLTKPGKERIAKFEMIKKLYGIRSKAVHGEPLTTDRLADGVDQSFALLRDLLLVALGMKSHFTAAIMNEAIMGADPG